MTAHVSTLLADLRRLGVRVTLVGDRVAFTPASRVPASTRSALAKGAWRVVREALRAESVVLTIGGADEQLVSAAADVTFGLYVQSARTRRACGTGLPGATARDEGYFRALAARDPQFKE